MDTVKLDIVKTDSNGNYVCAAKDLDEYYCEKCGYWTHLKVKFDEHERKVSTKNPLCYTCKRCKNFKSYSCMVCLKHILRKCKKENKGSAILRKCKKEEKGSEILRKGKKEENKWFGILRKCKREENKGSGILRKCKRQENKGSGILHKYKKEENKASEIWCECKLCPFKAKRADYVEFHVNYAHHSPKIVIPKRKHLRNETHRCYMCTSPQNKNVKEKPVRVQHQWFYCDHCGYSSKLPHFLLKHQKKWHNEDWFKCKECGYRTKLPRKFKTHVTMKHPGQIRTFDK